MDKQDDAVKLDYPHGRGYGHDYLRGGEVLGGYGYADREEYEQPLGERMTARHRASGDAREKKGG